MKHERLENRRQRVACWLNTQRLSRSDSTPGQFVATGSPTDYEWLRDKARRLERPGDRAIARNLIRAWEYDAIERARIAAARRAHAAASAAALAGWLQSLPAGARYTTARRGGYVAVLDGRLIGRLDHAGRAEGAAHPWFGCPYIESETRPLRDV